MALTPGTRLGVYEVTEQIGAGGMGEVYRATDSNLKRSVAIKVLPASVAGDADRLARSQREAEVLAALNHPNIAAIYGLEKTPDFTALVMELVEGEDLSQRLAQGAIPIDEALPIAKQIAEALEAAHEQGIIHRDLKPANIKVRVDGTVKVQDALMCSSHIPKRRATVIRGRSRRRLLVAAAMAGIMVAAAAAGQSPALRTIEGHSDLEGIWDYSTITPLERPKEFAARRLFSNAQAEVFERGTADRALKALPKLERQLNADLVGDFSTVDEGHLDSSMRTSLIINPRNGKLPPLTASAKARQRARRKAHKFPPDGPEALRLSDRCLPDVAGPPLLPTAYNNNVQIVQTDDYVVIATEMIHDARIIPLDGRPHLSKTVREWNGDSRGWWEADTLVIDTTNFRPVNALESATAGLHVVERLRRLDERSVLYAFTVTDRAAFTRSWSGSYTLRKSRAAMYEFACHEGNYSIVGMLRGARAQETHKP